MSLFEQFSGKKQEQEAPKKMGVLGASIAGAGALAAVGAAQAAELPSQNAETQKPTTIERTVETMAPGLAKIPLEDGRTATLSMPQEPQTAPITPEAFQPRPLAPETTPGAVLKSQIDEALSKAPASAPMPAAVSAPEAEPAPMAAITPKEAVPSVPAVPSAAETVTPRPLAAPAAEAAPLPPEHSLDEFGNPK